MTTGHVYILTDGVNTKIGITTSFDTRMASYATHNANVYEHRSYACDIEEARRIETTIKSAFRDSLSGKSKEWFTVPAETIDRYVSTLLEKPLSSPVLPSMHGVRLNEKARELKEEILNLLSDDDVNMRRKVDAKKNELMELFGESFGLGRPEHKLPPTNTIVLTDYTGVDIRHCAIPDDSNNVVKAVRDNRISFPYDDHQHHFYHLVRLESGHYVAISTARISMPYLAAISKDEQIRKMADAADTYGWYCTLHHEWSWHSPDHTGLVLYQPKTPVSERLQMWQGSFRKWTIEHQELLKMERYDNPDDLKKCIDDICHDNTFPLNINSYQDLVDNYLGPYFYINTDSDFWLRGPYEFLINKWKASTHGNN